MKRKPATRTAAKPRRKAAPATRLPREQRETQLIDVALQMFIDHGYQGTALDDIARAAGISRPIIYRLFGSKDAIYIACLKRARETLNQSFRSAGDFPSLEDRMRSIASSYFGFVENNQSSWKLLFGGGAAVAGAAAEQARELRFITVENIASSFAKGYTGLDRRKLELFAHGISGAGEQVAKWWIANPEVRQEEVVKVFMQFAWNGLSDLPS